MPLNPIMLDIPDHFETERLLLRVPRPGDGKVINQGVRESFDALKAWMPWAQTMPSVEDSELYAMSAAANFLLRRELPLLLFDRVDGYLVGASGMHNIDWDVPRFEIGYWLRTSLQGQGYMTEAVNGIVRFAFETLKAQRLEIMCDANNQRSAAVAERAGFTLEARMRNERRDFQGDLTDTLIFARLAE